MRAFLTLLFRSPARALAAAASLLVACGSSPAESRVAPAPLAPSSAERAPRGEASPRSDPFALLPTSSSSSNLCGDAAESAVRAAAPDLPPCADHTSIRFVTAHTDAGSVVVVASRQPDVRAVLHDGARSGALPAGAPRTEADGDALALGAILLRHGARGLMVSAAARDVTLARSVFGAYFSRLALGRTSGGPFVALGAFPEDATHRWHVDRYEAEVDARGEVRVSSPPLAFAGTDGELVISALVGAPPLPTTPHAQVVCGDPREAAVRLRAAELPPCDAAPEARYMALATPAGALVVTRWSQGRSLVLGASVVPQMGAALDASRGSIDDYLRILLFSYTGEGAPAVDRAAAVARAGDEARARTVLRRLGAGALGFHSRGDLRALVALGADDERDGEGPPTRTFYRYDVSAGRDSLDVRRRRLARFAGDREVEGEEAESTSYTASERFGCLDGL